VSDSGRAGARERSAPVGARGAVDPSGFDVRDPVLRLLHSQRALPDPLLIAIWMVLTGVVLFLRPALALADGFVPLGPTEIVKAAAWTLIIVPVVLYAYFWLPGSLARLVPELVANGVVGADRPEPPEGSVDEFIQHVERRIDRLVWPLLAIVFIAWYLVWDRPRLEALDPATRNQELLQLVVYAPMSYASVVLVGRLISGLAIVDDLFKRFDANVRPLHPDGAGGFGPLGHRLTYMAGVLGAVGVGALIINGIDIGTGFDAVSPATVFTTLGLVASSVLIVWAWLRAPHRAMLRARQRVAAPIGVAAERITLEPPSSSANAAEVTAALTAGNDELDALKRRETLVTEIYPTWPISTQGSRFVIATVSAPLILGLVDVVLELIRRVLGE
jgi:hypothetical protein